MGKHPWGNFCDFSSFHSNVNLFLQIMALSISNISLQKCYSKSFIENSYFPLKTRKFFPMDAFPYMVFHENIFEDELIVSSRARRSYDFEDKCFRDSAKICTNLEILHSHKLVVLWYFNTTRIL